MVKREMVMVQTSKAWRWVAGAAIGLGVVSTCFASDADEQVKSFFNIYESICLKHLGNLEEARQKLKPLPALPPEKAAHFLVGHAGTAWPVPDKHGVFVLVIHEKKNFCAVYARRIQAEPVEKKFATTFSKVRAPLQSVLMDDERKTNASGVATRTMAYSWSAPNARRKMLFTLTTSTSEHAPLQGMLSAATMVD